MGGHCSAQFCNLEMEGLEWLWEYIKLITLDIPIRIASSWATEILDNTLLKRFLRQNGKHFSLFQCWLKKISQKYLALLQDLRILLPKQDRILNAFTLSRECIYDQENYIFDISFTFIRRGLLQNNAFKLGLYIVSHLVPYVAFETQDAKFQSHGN